jgi:hypothetical protein
MEVFTIKSFIELSNAVVSGVIPMSDMFSISTANNLWKKILM